MEKRKAPKTAFKKGNPGGGRKPLPADIRAARNLSYEDMCRTVMNTRNMTPAELKQIDIENIPFGNRAIINAYAKMDYRAIKEYEDRIWGKSRENVDLSVNDITDRPQLAEVLKDIPQEWIIEIAKKL